jgi:hypothetical protein
MSGTINPRSFIKKSVIASAGASLGLSSKDKAISAQESVVPPLNVSNNKLPTGRIGNVTFSRLIAGGNPFSGWSHSRDLRYISELFKAYSTDEKILQTLEMYEENGINTILSGGVRVIDRYWNERGGKIQWIAQTHPKVNDLTTNIKRAIDKGAVAAYI